MSLHVLAPFLLFFLLFFLQGTLHLQRVDLNRALGYLTWPQS